MKKNLLRGVATTALVAVLTLPVGGCLGLAIAGAGATAGVAVAKEGGVRNAISDTQIRLQITDLWLKHDVHMYRRLDLTVREGRVLITGNVPTPDARVDAIRLAWQAPGVQQVLNEINVDNSAGFTGYASDVWITTQLKSKLLMDKYVSSINYTVDTVNGTVYLMGVAQDQKELDRVINHARAMGRVRNVVSYVRLRGQTPETLQTPSAKPYSAGPRGGQPAAAPAAANPGRNVHGTTWVDTTTNATSSSIQPGPEDSRVTSENLLPP